MGNYDVRFVDDNVGVDGIDSVGEADGGVYVDGDIGDVDGGVHIVDNISVDDIDGGVDVVDDS